MPPIEELIRKYNAGKCTEEERLLLEQWYQSFEWTDVSKEISDIKIEGLREEVWLYLQNKRSTDFPQQLAAQKSADSQTAFPLWRYAAAAVFIFGILGYSIYFFKTGAWSEENVSAIKSEVLPGSSQAELTLGDGRVVALDSAGMMQLTEADGTQIVKKSGNLVYADAKTGNEKILFNTLSTPRGGEYHLVLQDGTKVWLNAASSIRFPTSFRGKDRTVFLQGEAYFEVAKNKKMPFMVKLDHELTVKVLGTHFNIMAYADEDEVKTTLVEGKVSVTQQNKTVNLTPAKQAILNKSGHNLFVNDADISEELAWKNGIIELNDHDLSFIMRQISRWYDVDINFEGKVPEGQYNGAIRKRVPLAKVLEILKLTGVKCKLEGRKLIVYGK